MLVQIINEPLVLSNQIVKRVTEHSEKYAKTHIYNDSFQNNRDKIKHDSYNGKLAEFAVYNRIIEKGFECTKPDLNIYDIDKRSWEHDLVVKANGLQYNIHVKSCDARWGSWVFQADFGGRYDKHIFDNRGKTDLI